MRKALLIGVVFASGMVLGGYIIADVFLKSYGDLELDMATALQG